jgi:phenylpropionate dioxygenase-like ring-hydroxylating dioxygenase large terminal subunit
VARVGIYRGFVFGSMAADGPSLQEHLGAAMRAIDALCLRPRPTGEVEITAGFLKHKVRANWKFLVENETDGYHPSFVHASIFEVAQSGIGTLYSSRVHRRVARLRQRPHRKRPAPRVPQARRAAGRGSAPRPTSCPTTCRR